MTRWLWEKLALAGDPWALLTQAARLLKTPTNNDQLGIFPKIKVLAERNVWWAMVQYGHYLKQKGQLVNAASWYRKAMDLTKPLTREEIPLPLAGPGIQPWEAYATIQWKIGNLDEAERAAKIGAVEYHSYQGYMILSSILLKKKKCENLEECLTRAAMAHTPETCYRLGEIYRLWHHGREKLEKNGYHGNFLPEDMLPELMSMSSRYYTPDEYYNMAKEWFELASVQGHAMASVQLAVLLREGKMMDKGLKYLDRATDSPKYAEIVTELRELWHQPDADINTTMRKCVGL